MHTNKGLQVSEGRSISEGRWLRRGSWILACVLACAVFVGPVARADEVQLKSGKTVKGFILADTARSVRIKTATGKVMTFKKAEVTLVAESAEIGSEAIDERLASTDTEDADALLETAKWARSEGHKGWRLVARMALRIDDTHDETHEFLGHEKVGDKWYTSAKKAKKAREALLLQEMKEKGFVKWRRGWISKENRTLAAKDPKAFVLQDGVWRSKAAIMKEQGYIEVNGKWIRGGSKQDRTDRERFIKLVGEEIWVVTTPHFRIFAMEYPPDKVNEFADFAEEIYKWFVADVFKKDPQFPLFRNNRGNLWLLKDKATAVTWFGHYKARYGFEDDTLTLIERSGGNLDASGKLVTIITPRESTDPRHQIAHSIGHWAVRWFSRGIGKTGTPSWLVEAMGHMSEHHHCGSGQVNCSTKSDYGADGGIAEKAFATGDALDRAKKLARDLPTSFEELDKIDLNSLTGDNLVMGWTIVYWMLDKHPTDFVAWLEGMNQASTLDALSEAFKGWDSEKLEKEWKKFIKKHRPKKKRKPKN